MSSDARLPSIKLPSLNTPITYSRVYKATPGEERLDAVRRRQKEIEQAMADAPFASPAWFALRKEADDNHTVLVDCARSIGIRPLLAPMPQLRADQRNG